MASWLSNQLTREASGIAKFILSAEQVIIASHIDADGISAAAVASSALDRADIRHEVLFFKKLDDEAIDMLDSRSSDALVWLTDLGSGYLSKFAGGNIVITDHHEIEEHSQRGDGQTTIGSFAPIAHLNPHLFGYAGARDISGSGLAFITAMEMDPENSCLAHLAVIGAIGDMQDIDTRKLIGLNAEIVNFGVSLGMLSKGIDLRLFGTETRSLPKLLKYATDPLLPTLSGNGYACEEFLEMLKVDIADEDGGLRHWSELSNSEKRRIIMSLSRLILENGGTEEDVERLMGEVYVFPGEKKGSPTREAREFATLLNSCGRNDEPALGMEICKGDRSDALDRAFSLIRTHRENISNAIDFVREIGIASFGSIQHFHCADQVKDTIVGIIAGMLLGSGEVDRSKPLIGFVISEEISGEFKVKASVRTVREVVNRGINLASAVRRASERVGGIGGGHSVAAGATLPLGSEEEFIVVLEREICEQLHAQPRQEAKRIAF